MITDKETNTVYFSALLHSKDEYKGIYEQIKAILFRHKIKCKLLTKTADIWCRDYMPIQVRKDKLLQFRYEPSYLKDERHLQSNPKTVLRSNGIKAEFSDINLDGGNLIKWTDKAILTSRVFKENPHKEKKKLTAELEKLLEAELFFVPDITEDMTGHADGHLRFIDGKTVLVNELKKEFKYWQTGFLKMVSQSDIDFFEIPWFGYKDERYPESTFGSYVNYLEVNSLILFPIFETDGNLDEEAIEVIKKVFPDRIIETVNINGIAKYGGLLNCVTWTVKE